MEDDLKRRLVLTPLSSPISHRHTHPYGAAAEGWDSLVLSDRRTHWMLILPHAPQIAPRPSRPSASVRNEDALGLAIVVSRVTLPPSLTPGTPMNS